MFKKKKKQEYGRKRKKRDSQNKEWERSIINTENYFLWEKKNLYNSVLIHLKILMKLITLIGKYKQHRYTQE